MFKVIKVKEDVSKRGNGKFYWVFMRDLSDNRSCRTYIGTNYRNFSRWQGIISQVQAGKEIFLDGLVYRNKRARIIDADSLFTVAGVGYASRV